MNKNRLLQLTLPTHLGELILTNFEGVERLSTPYEFDLTAYGENSKLTHDDLLGQSVRVKIAQPNKESRYFYGIIREISINEADYMDWQRYQLKVVPALWLLNLRKNCRIFQDVSVVDIVKQILQEHKINSVNFTLKKAYPIEPYWVQYNESDLAFITRLLNQAGIYYTFIHEANNTIVCFTDSLNQLNLPITKLTFNEQSVISYQTKTARHANQVVIANVASPEQVKPIKGIAISKHSSIDFPLVNEFHCPTLTSQLAAQQMAQRKLDSITWQANQFKAQTKAVSLMPGSHIDFENQYWLYQVKHIVHDYTHLAGGIIKNNDDAKTQEYNNHIIAAATTMPFAPDPIIQYPHVPAMQAARVVGPERNTVHTDEFGRVKVHFFWNREATIHSDKGAYWLPVMQMQSGEQWGSQFLPRVGQEVEVQFLQGCIDKPIITGMRHNTQHVTQKNLACSRIKSHTLGAEQYVADGNEVCFDDTPRQQQLSIHAKRDLIETIGQNYQKTVELNETEQVDGYYKLTVNKGVSQIKAKKIRFNVGASQLVLDDNGIKISSPQVTFHTSGAGAAQPLARLGDKHHCPKLNVIIPHHGGPILKGSPNVFINNLPVARKGDTAHCHTSTDKLTHGAPNLLINGKPAARLNDKCDHGGVISQGSPNVGSAIHQVIPTLIKPELDLQTVKVLPRWRKWFPDAKFDDFSTLLRLPNALLGQVIQSILQHYTPATPKAAKGISVPRLFNQWSRYLSPDLLNTVKQALSLKQPQGLSPGWIYVYAKCASGPKPDFKKWRLFKEYQVKNHQFAEVDLSQYAGCDKRLAEGEQTYIELPYQYYENQQSLGKFEVQVFYSATQLSWPRAHKYGGLDLADQRLKQIKHKLLTQLENYKTDDKLRLQRSGKPIPAKQLDEVYKAQYEQKPMPVLANPERHQQLKWQQTCLYTLSKHEDKPFLLLDDPIGLIMQGNQLLTNLFAKLKAALKNIVEKPDSTGQQHGRTAILAQQLFFKYDYPDVIKQNGAYISANNPAGTALPWSRACGLLSPSKLGWYLNKTQRVCLHQLIKQTQACITQLLLQTWDAEKQAHKPCQQQGDWRVDLNAIYQDLFAQGHVTFGCAYASLLGLFAQSCLDSHSLDQKLTVDNRFINEFDSSPGHLETIRYQSVKPYQKLKNELDTMICEIGKVFKFKKPSELILLPQPAGYEFVKALHHPNFILHKSLFPIATKKPSHIVYLEANGLFNKAGFKQAWLDEDKLMTIADKSNDVFKTVIAAYLEKASTLHGFETQQTVPVKKMIVASKRTKKLYLDLIQISVNQDYQVTTMHFILQAEQSHVVLQDLEPPSQNIKAKTKHLTTDDDPFFKKFLNKAQAGSNLITLFFALWELRDQICELTEQSKESKSKWLVLAHITCTLVQSGAGVSAIKESLDGLLKDEKASKWLANTAFNKTCEDLSEKLFKHELGVNDLITGWGLVACGFTLIGSVLDLVNTLTGQGLRDPAKVVSQLFQSAANGFFLAGRVKQIQMSKMSVAEGLRSDIGFEKDLSHKAINEGIDADIVYSESEASIDACVGCLVGSEFLLLGIGCMVVSSVVSLFEHNKFQIWAENSIFTSSGNPYQNWALNSKYQYDALVGLLVLPKIEVISNDIEPTSKQSAIKVIVGLPSLYGLLDNDLKSIKFNDSLNIKGKFLSNLYSMRDEWQQVDFQEKLESHSKKAGLKYAYPCEVEYYYIDDLRKLAENDLEEYKNICLTPLSYKLYLIPGVQFDFKSGDSLPAKINFPNSQGTIDESIQWFDSRLGIGGESKQQIYIKDQLWHVKGNCIYEN